VSYRLSITPGEEVAIAIVLGLEPIDKTVREMTVHVVLLLVALLRQTTVVQEEVATAIVLGLEPIDRIAEEMTVLVVLDVVVVHPRLLFLSLYQYLKRRLSLYPFLAAHQHRLDTRSTVHPRMILRSPMDHLR